MPLVQGTSKVGSYNFMTWEAEGYLQHKEEQLLHLFTRVLMLYTNLTMVCDTSQLVTIHRNL